MGNCEVFNIHRNVCIIAIGDRPIPTSTQHLYWRTPSPHVIVWAIVLFVGLHQRISSILPGLTSIPTRNSMCWVIQSIVCRKRDRTWQPNDRCHDSTKETRSAKMVLACKAYNGSLQRATTANSRWPSGLIQLWSDHTTIADRRVYNGVYSSSIPVEP